MIKNQEKIIWKADFLIDFVTPPYMLHIQNPEKILAEPLCIDSSPIPEEKLLLETPVPLLC
jgi:hypothetical protein